MTASNFDPFLKIPLEDRYSLSHIFNIQEVAFDSSARALDEILIEVIEMKASELHIWFRSSDTHGHYRFRASGDFIAYTDLSVSHCQSITAEIYQLIADEEEVEISDARINSWGKSLSHKLSDNRDVRIYVNVGLSYPHGFDLICRVLVK